MVFLPIRWEIRLISNKNCFNGTLSSNIKIVEKIDWMKQKRKIYTNKTREFFEHKLRLQNLLLL